MKLRPCIDIHNGSVKQIVGSSLKDNDDSSIDNFVSDKGSEYYAKLYKSLGLNGGHVIMLNSKDSPMYESTKKEAVKALNAYRGGLMIGGGINNENALEFLDEGASHVIVTSFAFSNGEIKFDNLEKLKKAVGKEHVVLDLSCKKKDDLYYIVTDRWTKFTNVCLDEAILNELSYFCDEFLVHAVDVEGKNSGINEEIAFILKNSKIPVTYAGGIRNIEDIKKIRQIGENRIDFTVGTALDIFGGNLKLTEAILCIQ